MTYNVLTYQVYSEYIIFSRSR